VQLRNQDFVVETSRPVVVFDLDGVLAVSPAKETINDVDFFRNRWENPHLVDSNREMLRMLRSLRSSGWRVVVITARPEEFREQTVAWFQRFNVRVDYEERLTSIDRGVVLFMRDIGEEGRIGDASGWKVKVLDLLMSKGARVQFVVEDYKENVERMRTRVPVLSYEEVR